MSSVAARALHLVVANSVFAVPLSRARWAVWGAKVLERACRAQAYLVSRRLSRNLWARCRALGSSRWDEAEIWKEARLDPSGPVQVLTELDPIRAVLRELAQRL